MLATLKDQIDAIIKNIRALHPEDKRIYGYWDEMAALLAADEKETIAFLMSCDDAETIHDISSTFDDISYKLQGRKFIGCLDHLEKSFPKSFSGIWLQPLKELCPTHWMRAEISPKVDGFPENFLSLILNFAGYHVSLR